MHNRYIWSLPRVELSLGARTLLMGILNVTPDSFSDGGLYLSEESAFEQGLSLEAEGADIIDIGGESTRPGSDPISEEVEIRRIVPVVERLASRVRVPISVDTWRAGVARRAVDAGAQAINDISGFCFDPDLKEVVRNSRSGVVLMHSRGSRESLHTQPPSTDPVQTAFEDLRESLEAARLAGIARSAIVVDPGIGFSKDTSASYRVLGDLSVFSKLDCPLLVGTSRKSFIRAAVSGGPESILLGTAASVACAIVAGAHIVRVHDVGKMRVVAQVADRIREG